MSDDLVKLSRLLKAPSPPAELEERFTRGDEAMWWYNGWLKSLKPPAQAHPEYGWDPVVRWRDSFGAPIYWYVVGTAGVDSLVIESEATILSWANQYYSYYAAVNGPETAEAIHTIGGLPEAAPPRLEPSTPEAQFIIEMRGVEGW